MRGDAAAAEQARKAGAKARKRAEEYFRFCRCPTPRPSGRVYLGREACLVCGKLNEPSKPEERAP